MSCINCGSPFHEIWACPKPKSTAARIGRAGSVEPTSAVASAEQHASTASRVAPGSLGQRTAGTQAPPVDTARFEMIASMLPFAKTLDIDLILEAQKTIKRRGRPRTGFDKKAYDRAKAAERRERQKDKR